MESADLSDLYAIRELAEKFSKKEVEPEALKRDNYPFEAFDEKVVEIAASTGLLGLTLPEEYGGTGQGIRELAAVVEIVSRKDASMAMMLLSQSFASSLLVALGPEDVAKKHAALPDNGTPTLLASTFYNDPEHLPTSVSAAENGGGYTLEGELGYVACLPVAGATIVPASIDGDRIAFFLVRNNAVGVEVSDPVVSLGLKGFPVADMKFDKVEVSRNARLGGADAEKVYAEVAENHRCGVAAVAVGIIDGAYCSARDYAADRFQGRKQIIEHDMVRRMLSGMVQAVDVGSALVAQACTMADKGVNCSKSTILSIQQYLTKEAAEATTDGVQCLGGYGYMKDYGQEKRMRDAKQLQAVFGSSPTRVQKIIERRLATEIL